MNDSYHQHELHHRRARSLTSVDFTETLQLRQRQGFILGTTEGRIMSFKPNTRGNFIQAPFTSIQQACTGLEPGIPFNVELRPHRLLFPSSCALDFNPSFRIPHAFRDCRLANISQLALLGLIPRRDTRYSSDLSSPIFRPQNFTL
jgi:hypothetical protein